MSVQLLAVLINVALAVMKFTVGTVAASHALIADAFNSTGDVVATFVAWLAFRYGAKPPDDDHHYGHANAEALAGLLIGGTICATGVFICTDGMRASLAEREHVAPEALALWGAGVTAVVKEMLYRVSHRVGVVTSSPTLLASANDHRADVVAALVALVGVWIARSGFPQFDAIAAIAIGIYIFFLGLEPLRSNLGILMHAAPPHLDKRAAEVAARIPGVVMVRQVRVQPLGGMFRMDMVLTVSSALTVGTAHAIAHAVEDAIRQGVDNVIEVHVHVEPAP